MDIIAQVFVGCFMAGAALTMLVYGVVQLSIAEKRGTKESLWHFAYVFAPFLAFGLVFWHIAP